MMGEFLWRIPTLNIALKLQNKHLLEIETKFKIHILKINNLVTYKLMTELFSSLFQAQVLNFNKQTQENLKFICGVVWLGGS